MASGYTTPPVYALIQPSIQAGMQPDMPAHDQRVSRIARPLGYAVKPITAQFDKLVSVSRIFFDYRYAELQKEVKALKLSLFWRDHNLVKLKEAMAFANQKATGPKCSCLSCCMAGRDFKYDHDDHDKFICTFRPYFDELLQQGGLLKKSGNWDRGVEHESAYNSVFDETVSGYVFDVDAHVVTSGVRDWLVFTYGSKLWKEQSVESVELKKLDNLFQSLYYFEDDEPLTG